MSATWIRAQELGQPLMWTLMGESRAPSRRSSSSTTRAACAFVSTIASLQNSMPVHAITERRQASRRADRPHLLDAGHRASRPVDSSRSSTSSFCIGVVRMRCEPCASATSASRNRLLPFTRPGHR